MEIPGDMPNFKKRTWIFRGINAKKWKIFWNFQEGDGKIDWKSRVFNYKKINTFNQGVQFIFWKKKTFMFLLRIGRPFRGKFQFAQWSTSAPTFLWVSSIKRESVLESRLHHGIRLSLQTQFYDIFRAKNDKITPTDVIKTPEIRRTYDLKQK